MNISAEDFPLSVKSWEDLSALVAHFSRFIGHDWLFRGVTNASHALIPTIGRKASRRQRPLELALTYDASDERAVFSMFKQQARAYVPNSPQTDLEWLAIAQHHGMPTRLLDWTEGLLVSAWFAVLKGGAKQHDSAIWVTKGIRDIDVRENADPLALPDAVAFRPPYITPRIGAQGSVLVVCPEPSEELNPAFVRKIVIERTSEFTLKKRLNACGINHRALFPDLGGLSDHLGWLYKNGWLAGYKTPKSSWDASDDSADAQGEGSR